MVVINNCGRNNGGVICNNNMVIKNGVIIDSSGSMGCDIPYSGGIFSSLNKYEYDENVNLKCRPETLTIQCDTSNICLYLGQDDEDIYATVFGEERAENRLSIESIDDNKNSKISAVHKGSSSGNVSVNVYIPKWFAGNIILKSSVGNIKIYSRGNMFKSLQANTMEGNISWLGDVCVGGIQAKMMTGNFVLSGKLLCDLILCVNGMSSNIEVQASDVKRVTGYSKTSFGNKKIEAGDYGKYELSLSLMTMTGNIKVY